MCYLGFSRPLQLRGPSHCNFSTRDLLSPGFAGPADWRNGAAVGEAELRLTGRVQADDSPSEQVLPAAMPTLRSSSRRPKFVTVLRAQRPDALCRWVGWRTDDVSARK